MATTDGMAFLCGRVPQPIESLKNLSNMRVPDVAKFRIYADVPKKDPLQKLPPPGASGGTGGGGGG